MKVFTFKVVVQEGSDEFWEELAEKNKTGADEVTAILKDTLAYESIGLECEVSLLKFEDNDP